MWASVTLTMRPGNDPGGEQVVCAKRYPAPPPIIPAPVDEAVDRPPAPIIPDPVQLPELQPAKTRAAIAAASDINLRDTTTPRIHRRYNAPTVTDHGNSPHAITEIPR